MTLDQQITHAAARVAVAVSNGEEKQIKQWEAEVVRLMDQRDRLADSIARLEARHA
jgi:ubiquinone biosynthesis protein UbiJ